MLDWTEQCTLRVSDCDADGRWKLSCVLRQMQEMGETNAAMLGCGRVHLIEQKMCWVLYRLKLSFDKRPMMGDTVRVSTWPGGVAGLFFLRYFRFETQDGTLLGEAATTWVLFNLDSRRLLRPTALPIAAPVVTDRVCSLELPAALDLHALTECGARNVRYTDLDMNGHMNNARYADWAEDALCGRYERPIRTLQINYVAEARLGDWIKLRTRTTECSALLEGRRDGEVRAVFEAQVGF